jgi:uncharacterized MAPEG superfamily protein
MSTDLTLLAWSALLCLVLAIPYTIGLTQLLGLSILAGNRENFPTVEGWIGRAKRAHMNMIENLIPFAALILVAHVAGKANAMTALGAQLFFWGRLAHAGTYIAGIAWVRTGSYAVALVGMLIIFVQIIR